MLLTLVKGLRYRLGGRGESSMDIPDDLSPAHVAMLWEPRDFVRRAVPATLLDLVQRGVIAMEPIAPGDPGYDKKAPYSFRATGRHGKDLRDYEHALMSLLFHDAVSEGPVSMARLREYAEDDGDQMGSRLRQFKYQAVDADRWGLLSEADSLWVKTLRVAALPVMAFSLLAAGKGDDPWLLVAIPLGIAVMYVAPRLVCRPSEQGVAKFRAYRRLRNFMAAADGMDWKPPEAVVVWERYLVLAVVFGLADKVLKALAVKAPAVAADPAFPAWIWLGDDAGLAAPWMCVSLTWSHAYSTRPAAHPAASYADGYAGQGLRRRSERRRRGRRPRRIQRWHGRRRRVLRRRRWRRRGWRRRRRVTFAGAG